MKTRLRKLRRNQSVIAYTVFPFPPLVFKDEITLFNRGICGCKNKAENIVYFNFFDSVHRSIVEDFINWPFRATPIACCNNCISSVNVFPWSLKYFVKKQFYFKITKPTASYLLHTDLFQYQIIKSHDPCKMCFKKGEELCLFSCATIKDNHDFFNIINKNKTTSTACLSCFTGILNRQQRYQHFGYQPHIIVLPLPYPHIIVSPSERNLRNRSQ